MGLSAQRVSALKGKSALGLSALRGNGAECPEGELGPRADECHEGEIGSAMRG